MRRNLGLRIGLVVVVIAVSVWYLYPPRTSINLGLDLQGGIHLVLGVDVDKALEAQVERAGDTVRGELEKKGIAISKIERRGIADLAIQIASPQSWDSALATVTEVLGAFDRKEADQAAGGVVMTLKPREVTQIRELAVRQGLETIRNRVDQFGVAEPSIQQQGENRILIQLPGVQDPARAKALIGKTALLEFRLLDERTSVEQALAGQLPETSEILYRRDVDKQTKAERKVPHVVQKRSLLTGAELTRAEVQADPNSTGNWQVAIEFTSTGARVFGEVTVDEARDLAIVLRAGALPAPVVILEERTVGPSLGADSIRQGLIAITGSAVVVFIFMLVYYRLSGFIADLALGLNLLILFAWMAAFGATLTLPGLAGIALTVGMAVDTNILIFERIREELRVGKTPRAAIEAGFRRAFRTIVDTHLTVMGTAIILLSFGTSSVKGFGVSLFIGLGASLFTAYFFTRLLFDLVYMGRRTVETISI